MTSRVVYLAVWLIASILFLLSLSNPAIAQGTAQKQPDAVPVGATSKLNATATSQANSPVITAALIDTEFQMLAKRNQIAELLKLDSLIDSFVKSRDGLKRAIENAKSVNCETDPTKLNDDYESVSRAMSSFWVTTQELQKSEGLSVSPILGNFFAASSSDRCKLLQQEASRHAIDNAVNQFEEISKANKIKLADLRGDLLKLQDGLQQTLSNQGAIRVAENLPVLISIIAGASIAIILVVRLFSADLQMEWVASGQVIQFTTVMILLSALMVLGLTGILGENTLGTLLGGLAGYVLAQGVGRATARATLNAANAANAAPNSTRNNQPNQ